MLGNSPRISFVAIAAGLFATSCGNNHDTVWVSPPDFDEALNSNEASEEGNPSAQGMSDVEPSDPTDGGEVAEPEAMSGDLPLETPNGTDGEVETTEPLDAEPPQFVSSPSVVQNPNAAAPLAAIVEFETDAPTTAEILIVGGDESWSVLRDEPKTLHSYPLIGFKPDTSYALQVTVESDSLSTVSGPMPLRTPPLPEEFPPLTVSISEPDEMEPGMTLFNARGPNWIYLVIIDANGTVRWHYRNSTAPTPTAHRILENGNFAAVVDSTQVFESDMLGNVVRRWHAANWPGEFSPPEGSIPIETDTLHHEVFEMPNGNLVTLGTELRNIDGYPVVATDPLGPTETAPVVGDVVLEFQPDGTLAKRISLLDLIDPTRVGHDSGSGFWNRAYPGDNTRDWSHSNAVSYDPASDAYLVSVRHQDCVLKISRADESLVWILGNHEGWKEPWAEKLLTPSGPLQWQFHQHAVKVTPNGGIGMFDNGNNRTTPPTPTPPVSEMYSRAIEYLVDESTMTVSELSSFGAAAGEPGSFFARFISDADWMPATGNILVTPGGQRTTEEPQYDFAQIIEVTVTGRKVFELTMKDDSDLNQGMTIYRSERIPDIRH